MVRNAISSPFELSLTINQDSSKAPVKLAKVVKVEEIATHSGCITEVTYRSSGELDLAVASLKSVLSSWMILPGQLSAT